MWLYIIAPFAGEFKTKKMYLYWNSKSSEKNHSQRANKYNEQELYCFYYVKEKYGSYYCVFDYYYYWNRILYCHLYLNISTYKFIHIALGISTRIRLLFSSSVLSLSLLVVFIWFWFENCFRKGFTREPKTKRCHEYQNRLNWENCIQTHLLRWHFYFGFINDFSAFHNVWPIPNALMFPFAIGWQMPTKCINSKFIFSNFRHFTFFSS